MAADLRTLLAADGLVVAPFVVDALQAVLAEQAGARAVYVTGFGTAATYGVPDLGIIGLDEIAGNARRIAGAVDVPVVADADTGYGDVEATIAAHVAAGVSAVHLEDQVWPKRCGFFDGKEVVPAADHEAVVRAAVREADGTGLVVIARTDALQPHGWDEAVDRAHRYRDAGADLVFVDGLKTRADAEACAERLGEVPLVYNGVLPAPDVEALGFRLMLAIASMLATFDDVRRRMRQLVETGAVPGAAIDLVGEMATALGADDERHRSP